MFQKRLVGILFLLAPAYAAAQPLTVDQYQFERTVQILDVTDAGFLVFELPAGTTVGESNQPTLFAPLYRLIHKYRERFSAHADSHFSASEARRSLILVNPESTLELGLHSNALTSSAGHAPLTSSDFRRIQALLEMRARSTPRRPLAELDKTVVDRQAVFNKTDIPLPLATYNAGAADAQLAVIEVERLIITDGDPQARSAPPPAGAKPAFKPPKKVETLVVRDEPPQADAAKVKIRIAEDGEIIDRRTTKPEAEQKQRQGLSKQNLQMLYTLGGLIGLSLLIYGLNRYVSRQHRKRKSL